MTTKRLSWVFELYDRMSGPSRRIGRELAQVERELSKVEKAERRRQMAEARAKISAMKDPVKKEIAGMRLQRDQLRMQRDELRQLQAGTKRAGDGWGWFGIKLMGWITVARAALSVMSGLARGVAGPVASFFGAGIKAASFKENTMLGLNMMLRDKGKAKALYQEAVNFADVSPFETQPVLQWYRMLVPGVGTGGLGSPGGSNILKVLAGLGDIASSQSDPNEAMGRIIQQINQMISKGRLTGEDLRPLSDAGVNRQKVYEILAKRHGISLQEALSQKWEGKFGAGEALEAILRFSQDTFGGGKLGGGMGPASQTLTGLMSTLRSRPYRMFEDIGETAGFKSMKTALSNLVNVLDPTTPQGARIKKNVEQLFDRVLGGVFKRFEDPAAMEAWVKGLLEGFERLIPKVEAFARAFGVVADKALALAERLAPPSDLDKAHNSLSGRYGPPSYFAAQNARKLIEQAGGKLTPEEAGIYDAAERAWFGPHGVPNKAPVVLGKDAVQINVNGSADPQATAAATVDAFTSWLERIQMQQGANRPGGYWPGPVSSPAGAK